MSLTALDLAVTRTVQSWQGSMFLPLAKIVSWFGETWIAISLVILFAMAFYVYHYRRAAVFTLATLSAPTLSYLLKLIINRPRPSSALINVYTPLTDSGFPSGHVTFYIVFFGFLIYLTLNNKNWSKLWRLILFLISLVLIISISLSRIYLGTHWLSDVLGGYLLGTLILWLLIRLYRH